MAPPLRACPGCRVFVLHKWCRPKALHLITEAAACSYLVCLERCGGLACAGDIHFVGRSASYVACAGGLCRWVLCLGILVQPFTVWRAAGLPAIPPHFKIAASKSGLAWRLELCLLLHAGSLFI